MTHLSNLDPKTFTLLLFKMKITNLNSRSHKELKFESKDIKAREQGITRRLLEKYKPKYICDVENLSGRNNEKRVA